MNLLTMMWLFMTFAISFGYLIILYPKIVPVFVKKLYLYGKSAVDERVVRGHIPPKVESGILAWLQVPKRYFSHFYIFATAYASAVTSVVLISYHQQKVPKELNWFFNIAAGERDSTNVSSVATIVALLLFLAHVARRAYESIFVSVFSSTSKMNIIHYIFGILFYFGVTTSLLAEAPGFTSEGFRHKSFQQAYNCRWYQVIGTAFYFWAAWHQNKCATIMANMRKDKKGQVAHQHHGIPRGDWFDFVSNPHFLAEILIYLAFNIVLEFQNTLIILALIFTAFNQVLAALISHNWLVLTFGNYPLDRKAIIPFIL